MQGRVRTKTVKKASRVIIEKYYNRLTMDFDTNKRICEEVAIIQSKRLRNKIAGFTTVRHASCRASQRCPPGAAGIGSKGRMPASPICGTCSVTPSQHLAQSMALISMAGGVCSI